METPAWSNSWYPYRHNSVPYVVPQVSETYTADPNSNSGYSDRMYHQTMNIQQAEVRSSVINPCRSPFANGTEPEVTKEPLSQLQELANVFSPSVPCSRTGENDQKDFSSSKSSDAKFANSSQIKMEVESSINHDSDSGYVTDQPQQPEAVTHVTTDFAKTISKIGVTDVLMTENNGEPFIESFENGGQSNYINMDDVFLDCNFLSGEKNFGSNTSLDASLDQGKNVLPGFHQAFGSTEIGRFSRNDFFTNTTPEKTNEKVSNPRQVEPQSESTELSTRKMRAKSVRKPRKLKNTLKKTDEQDGRRHLNSPEEFAFCEKKNGCVRKGRKTLNNDKSDSYSRHHPVMSEQEPYSPSPFGYPSPGQVSNYGSQSMPSYRNEPPSQSYHLPRNQLYQGVDHPCGNQYLRPPDSMFSHSYEGNQHRYGYPDYPSANGYPYLRNNYPNYSNYEYPYFRPFGFNLDHGESWPNSNGNWSVQGWMGPAPPPPQQPSYNSWTSSNMFPFMRLDY
ncbi:hypothetical protein RUM44_013719 [Polyplax serrata]|uniref:Uncharacterized protein n=1 Tax=Polyplax serrata TaxID=468196 RepID=A0ABR1BEZ6_POLSC